MFYALASLLEQISRELAKLYNFYLFNGKERSNNFFHSFSVTIDWNVEKHPEDCPLTKITTTVNYYASFLFHLIHESIMKEDHNIFIGALQNSTHSP